MKNIFKFSAIALLVAGFFTSCAKELSAPVQAPVNGKTHTFTLAFAENNTKVAVTEAGKTTWEVGDEILIHGAGETNKTIVTLKAEDILADGKKAQITFSGIEPYDRSSDRGYTSVYYAQYPASASKQSGDFFYYADFVETNDFLMAAYNVDSTFVFYNLTGVITFKADGNFNSYKFKGNNGETVGYTQLRSRLANKADAPVLEYKYSASGDLTEIEGTAVPGELNHICLPLGTDFTGGFTITLCKNGRELYTATTQTAVKVDRNQILSVGDITDKLVELPAPETNDHTSAIALERAVDLSAEGSANSYIITAPGVYKLPAVKGNSTEKLPMLFDAEILWESYSNAEEVEANSVIAAIDYEGEWVVFKTPDALKPGNALIAAEDFKGNVLWSWHIWIPATPIETNTYGISTHKLMDRNLGALVAADTTSKITGEMLGLAYQWGRKDPFVSVGSIDATTPAKVAGIARTKNAESNDPGVAMTVAETIANPTVFVNRKGDWNAEPDNNLWAEEKTIYDPCPPGYKVPASSEVDIFASDATIDNIKGWAYDATKSHTFAVGEPATVFPIGGYLNYSGSYDKPGERVKIYHAPSVSQYAPAVYVYAGPTFKPQEGQRRAVAGNVRCVTIEGEAVQNLKFGLREGEEANLTAAFDST
ncbi:MAG: hypothetical protein IKS71_05020, partial [Bacteroidales bacterium]|nr:hypothetical protein [Bacteroidales bacterium]